MLNKKLSRILGLVLGAVLFMTSLGVGQTEIFADYNINTAEKNLENKVCDIYKDYSIKINKSVDQNGIKITLDSATGTKHNLNVVMKVESDKPFDKEKLDDFISEVSFANSYNNSDSKWFDHLDDKTFLLHLEEKNRDDEFAEKGNLRVDIAFPKYKVNVGIESYVDFSESYKKITQEKLAINIPEFNLNLGELESDVMETTIKYNGYSDVNNSGEGSVNSFMILKNGNKMYRANSIRCCYSNDEFQGEYIAQSATYDKLNDISSLSIIPIKGFMTYEEVFNMYTKDKEKSFSDTYKEILNNVKYKKLFKFSDGTKGEIYNIERKDNTVKVYCKGNSEKQSLLMASNMYMNYEPDKEEIFYESYKYTSFYKDPNDELGYVVEFNNIKDNKLMEIHLDCTISKIDKYKIGKEIELSK
ncbi:DUF4179 domain-containing protein [Clostridium botulinum]|uniref:DUF4179 domain-containing protein n=1 Tax=Clostridium botulinum TaxID=1491 RepID=A0A0L9YAP1_CLOBO|nr:DUF4179 domain-containing protein [Clostridium botulinum]KAI3349565.1 DUF4179 domain-containing protein [Clostridium botulinum]KOM88539.1 hypothetical protein ACP51_04700 [Clostridium botulinum]KOR57376.1 hypothetical protein ADT22_11390 [Clostridium botulinum]MBN1035714.1 DUF4179 domain-containing protein [Clostridium botulinum]MBN1048970.1 DUF4179 domain-containing protein [Clostridium botulinum]